MVDEMRFKLVDCSRIGHKKDSFVFTTQAKQVFYVEDPINPRWSIVLSFNPRNVDGIDVSENFENDMSTFARRLVIGLDEEPNYVMPGEGTWIDIHRKRKKWLVKTLLSCVNYFVIE